MSKEPATVVPAATKATPPAAAKVESPKTPPGPQPKVVHLERRPGEAWRMTCSDNVGLKDINRLVQKIRNEYLRSKRRLRLKKRMDARNESKKGLINVPTPAKPSVS